MEIQYVFNALVAITTILITALIYKIRSLEERDTSILEEVHEVHLLVAGEYIKRAEFESSLKAVFDSLRRIEDKLGTKADKA